MLRKCGLEWLELLESSSWPFCHVSPRRKAAWPLASGAAPPQALPCFPWENLRGICLESCKMWILLFELSVMRDESLRKWKMDEHGWKWMKKGRWFGDWVRWFSYSTWWFSIAFHSYVELPAGHFMVGSARLLESAVPVNRVDIQPWQHRNVLDTFPVLGPGEWWLAPVFPCSYTLAPTWW